MSQPSAIAEVLRSVASVLSPRRARWYLFGAQAVAVYGTPRLTADVDITLDISLDDVADLVEALTHVGFEARTSDPVEFARRTRVVPVQHVATGIPVDIVVAGPGLEQDFLERVRSVDLAGLSVPVISPEDLLVTKLLAGRSKDLDDARGILRGGAHDLDLGLVRSLLGMLDTALARGDLARALEAIIQETGAG